MDKTSGGSTIRTVTYYPVAGAMRIDSTLYYILKDHLGSASVVTDSSGNTVGEQRYYPFGETRLTTGSMYTDKLFTGQREMAGLGIYHYGTRFYSPKLGRFLSADSIVPGMANPQNLNRFSYVGNNPLRYVDPTGHIREECGEAGEECPGDNNDSTTSNTGNSGSSDNGNLVDNGSGGNGDDGDGGDDGDRNNDPDRGDRDNGGTGTGNHETTVTTIPTVTIPTVTIPTVTSTEVPTSFTQTSSNNNPSPLVSIAGVLLLVNLGVLDTVLAIGIISVAATAITVPGAQLGLAGELVLLPLEFISLNLTIYAAQMAATGSADHDPLPILHAAAPDVLPYNP